MFYFLLGNSKSLKTPETFSLFLAICSEIFSYVKLLSAIICIALKENTTLAIVLRALCVCVCTSITGGHSLLLSSQPAVSSQSS